MLLWHSDQALFHGFGIWDLAGLWPNILLYLPSQHPRPPPHPTRPPTLTINKHQSLRQASALEEGISCPLVVTSLCTQADHQREQHKHLDQWCMKCWWWPRSIGHSGGNSQCCDCHGSERGIQSVQAVARITAPIGFTAPTDNELSTNDGPNQIRQPMKNGEHCGQSRLVCICREGVRDK